MMVRLLPLLLLVISWIMPPLVIADDPILANLGYPQLLIEVDDDSFTLPNQMTAGRTLVVLENVGTKSRKPVLAQLPADLEPAAIASVSAATPPPWLFASFFPGFPSETPAGARRVAIVDLAPGNYAVIDDFVATFTVLAPMTAPATPSPPPGVAETVRLYEYGFQLPETLTAGHHRWEIVNAGREPHELLLLRAPAPISADEVMARLMAEPLAGPSITARPRWAEFEPVGGIGWLTPGQTGWTEVDLAPGAYVAFCFVLTPDFTATHTALGMIHILTVE